MPQFRSCPHCNFRGLVSTYQMIIHNKKYHSEKCIIISTEKIIKTCQPNNQIIPPPLGLLPNQANQEKSLLHFSSS